jgi:hypothetical protein
VPRMMSSLSRSYPLNAELSLGVGLSKVLLQTCQTPIIPKHLSDEKQSTNIDFVAHL